MNHCCRPLSRPPSLSHAVAPLRRVPILLALAALSLAAQAQTWGGKHPPPTNILKYYQAIDLGGVAANAFSVRSIGCIARNGAVALTAWQWYVDPDNNATKYDRAVIAVNAIDRYTLYYYSDGKQHTRVSGCNSSNEYVGMNSDLGGGVWDIAWSSYQRLPTPPGLLSAEPRAINDSRQVVGRSAHFYVEGIRYKAVLWPTSQTPNMNIPATAATVLFDGEAVAINNLGQVAGTEQSGKARFVDLRSGQQTTLLPPGAIRSSGTGLDEQGRVVGVSVDGTGRQAGFVWHNGVFAALRSARIGSRTLTHPLPRAIGADRMVVGQSYDVDGQNVKDPQATVWPQAGSARNLNYEASVAGSNGLNGLNLTDAIGVADNGTVLAEGRDRSTGERRAVLLVPRPGGRWSLTAFP